MTKTFKKGDRVKVQTEVFNEVCTVIEGLPANPGIGKARLIVKSKSGDIRRPYPKQCRLVGGKKAS